MTVSIDRLTCYMLEHAYLLLRVYRTICIVDEPDRL